jgi:prolipoprotein diacylglyceryltransferase
VLGAYSFLYGLTRGTVEFFRGDPGRTPLAGGEFSLMQLASVGLMLLGAWLWFRPRFGAARPAPDTPGPATA